WLVHGFAGEPAATATPDPRFPCPWPAFFYPGVNFDGYLTEQPTLRYSKEWLMANMAQALQAYIDEGNVVAQGISVSDPFWIGTSYASRDMPTGHEPELQAQARALARERQAADPGYRLT